MKNNNQLGIYIHIPFCVQKCIYCDFLSAPANEETKYSYVHALIKEIEKTSKDFKDRDVNSIFFGGGTPSTLDPILKRKKEAFRKMPFDHVKNVQYNATASSRYRKNIQIIRPMNE